MEEEKKERKKEFRKTRRRSSSPNAMLDEVQGSRTSRGYQSEEFGWRRETKLHYRDQPIFGWRLSSPLQRKISFLDARRQDENGLLLV